MKVRFAMELKFTKELPLQNLIDLYSSVGWIAYTRDPERLKRAVEDSSFVVSLWNEDELIALARCISDDATIMYLQDILVKPSHQRQGCGRRLVADAITSRCRKSGYPVATS